eukprot:TRINITY_DN25929_c0_g1_i1.p1 TRINITY_DN25929_c0_g1~~TRINITY_DN25929_c0_g1_i1.p1  ORF type:complete len:487 (+),score=49.03 TRINITY_DN25929_c0_g1_i1:101-1561(+)
MFVWRFAFLAALGTHGFCLSVQALRLGDELSNNFVVSEHGLTQRTRRRRKKLRKNSTSRKKKLLPSWDQSSVDSTCPRLAEENAEEEEEEELETELIDYTTEEHHVRRFRIQLPGASGDAYMPYYGSADLDSSMPLGAELVVLMFHGTGHSGLKYFCMGARMLGVQKRFDINSTFLVAPEFYYRTEYPQPLDLWWNGSNLSDDYRMAAMSAEDSGGRIFSYEVIDQMILRLVNASFLPKLEQVMLVGHSAGAMFVNRYAATMHLPLLADIFMTFVIANPSTYLYMDSERWAYTCDRFGCTQPVHDVYNRSLGQRGYDENKHGARVLSKQNGKRFVCRISASDEWPYGLDTDNVATVGALGKAPVSYIRRSGELAASLKVFPRRDVVYFVGQNDTCTDDLMPFGCAKSCWRRFYNCSRSALDMRCRAMLQGWNRNMRGKLYMEHLENHFGRPVHRLYEVPNVGHQPRSMLCSDKVREVLFPPRLTHT